MSRELGSTFGSKLLRIKLPIGRLSHRWMRTTREARLDRHMLFAWLCVKQRSADLREILQTRSAAGCNWGCVPKCWFD